MSWGTNKHIFAKHPTVWCKWKIVNLGLAMKEQQQDKSKMKSMASYKAIT